MQGLYKVADHIRSYRLREKFRSGRSKPEQVDCFWLGKRVTIHEASVHFNPLNPVCRSCAACMKSYAEEAVIARQIYEALSADPSVVYDSKALQDVINLVADLENRLHRRKRYLEREV